MFTTPPFTTHFTTVGVNRIFLEPDALTMIILPRLVCLRLLATSRCCPTKRPSAAPSAMPGNLFYISNSFVMLSELKARAYYHHSAADEASFTLFMRLIAFASQRIDLSSTSYSMRARIFLSQREMFAK